MYKSNQTYFRELSYRIVKKGFHYLVIHDGTQAHYTDMDVILCFTHVELGDMS
jgi:hypothetical protein